MRSVARVSLGALACIVVLAAGGWVYAQWSGAALDEVNLPAAGRLLMAEVHRQDGLEIRLEAETRCLQDKDEVIRALLDGSLSPAEAIDQFRRVDDERDRAVDGTEHSRTDEVVCENLLEWAHSLADTDARRAGRVAQVEAEVDGYLHRPMRGA